MSRFSAKFNPRYIEIFDEEYVKPVYPHKLVAHHVWLIDEFYMHSYQRNQQIPLQSIGCERSMTPEEIYNRCIAYICLSGN